MTVICCCRPSTNELGAACAVRLQIALPVMHVLTSELAEALQRGTEQLVFGVDDRVRAVGREDTTGPAALTDFAVMLEGIDRRLSRGERLDVESVKKSAWTEGRRAERGANLVEIAIGSG